MQRHRLKQREEELDKEYLQKAEQELQKEESVVLERQKQAIEQKA